MKISIKKAFPENVNDINHLLRLSKGHWGYSSEFLDRFMQGFSLTVQYIQEQDIKLFYINSRIAGFFNFIINKDNMFELDNFFLHPDYIGQGIGRALWNSCCQLAEKCHYTEFVIWSDPNAEPFYLKMGCKKIGVRVSPTLPNRYPPVLKFKLPVNGK